MPQKTIIQDPENKEGARVVNHSEKSALVVATRPLKTFENSLKFFTNEDYGIDMNINASEGAGKEEIHNGIDTVLWTASDIVGGGKTTFNSTDRAYEGSRSIKVDNSPINDIYQIAKGSNVDMNNYVSLTLWINVDKDWKNNDVVELYGYDTGTGLQVGDSVDLSDYFSYNSYDVWQKISIPLTDMGDLSTYATLDAIRIKQTAKDGPKAPKYYIDTIQFNETGAPVAYTLEPKEGTWLHVHEFVISIADEMAGTLEDGTMPALAYNKVLGETLSAGINYQRIQAEIVQFSLTFINLLELIEVAGSEIVSTGSDGTNTWVTLRVKHQEPLILKSEFGDKLQWTIAEDLTGLLHFRVNAGCSIEDRCDGECQDNPQIV